MKKNHFLGLDFMRFHKARIKNISSILMVMMVILSTSCASHDVHHSSEKTPAFESFPLTEWLPSFIIKGMADWDIPGLAIAVVQNDSILFQKGFGVQKLGHPYPVDETTLFGVASTTKAMTAAALGILVDQGVINWDDHVINYLPDFSLHDPWVTQHITIRDLLTHRSGYGRMVGNRLQYMTHRSRAELLYRLRYLEPEAPFRSQYVYSNMMYMVAGEVLRTASGHESWDDAIQELLFQPLGMNFTNTSITQFTDADNAAWPHQFIEGEVVAIPRRNFDNVGASASVNTNLVDFSRWMRFHLGEPGVLDGQRVLSEATMAEMMQPQVVIRQSNPYGDLSAYGLGWSLGYYEGYRVARHGGATDGMNTSFVIVPEANVGIVVMTNTFNLFREALVNTVLDVVLNTGNDRNWHDQYLQSYQRRFELVQAERDRIHEERQNDIPSSLPVHQLAGAFYNSLYADINVMYKDGDLSVIFWEDETLEANLEHWEGDVWRAVWRNPAQREKFVRFVISDDVVEALEITFNLRPALLQVGAYPSNYTRTVDFSPKY